jgi:hypothetical protein
MNTAELRRVFEKIAATAQDLRLQGVYSMSLEHIIAQSEYGISLITHLPSEPSLPIWENHERPPRWMMEIGVDNDRFNPHLENPKCKTAGCVPAMPIEIPRSKP